jgi:hypothetical protein
MLVEILCLRNGVLPMPYRRTRIAVLALVLIGVGGTISGCAFINSVIHPKPVFATPTPQATADVFSLAVGQCVERPSADAPLATIRTVDCSTAHNGELFGSFTLTGSSYSGDLTVKSESIAGCESRFAVFAGITYAKSTRLSFWWLAPNARSWKGGDRQVSCFIEKLAADGGPIKNTGSLKGAHD